MLTRYLLSTAALAAALVAVAVPGTVTPATASTSATANSLPFPQTESSVIPDYVDFIEAFSHPTLHGWSVATGAGRWSVASGHLAQTRDIVTGDSGAQAVRRTGTDYVAGDSKWADVDYSVSMRSDDDGDVGMVFRYQDAADYYRVSWSRTQHYYRLVKVVDGQAVLLDQVVAPLAQVGGWRRFQVIAQGTSITVNVDGLKKLSATDSSLATGLVGLYSYDSSTSQFDNVDAKVGGDPYFSIVVVPDTQYESKSKPSYLADQTSWITNHRASDNIAMVLQEGDVVDDLYSQRQWSNASKYLDYLDGSVPYSIAAGNHDLEYAAGGLILPPLPTIIGPYNRFMSKFSNTFITGKEKSGDYRAEYQLFTAGGVKMMVMNLEYGAPNGEVAWAGKIVNRYPDRHVILLTHDFLGQDNKLRGWTTNAGALPSYEHPGLNNGTAIWSKFVKTHKNVQFVFNGHVSTPTKYHQYSVGRRVTKDNAGREVYQVLTNFQHVRPAGHGYMRLFKFYPSTGTVTAQTFTPVTGKLLGDKLNQFSFTKVNLGAW